MPLEITKNIRAALVNDQPLKAGDVMALLTTAEHLWQQLVSMKVGRTSQHRRAYMCQYMARYRREIKAGTRIPKRRRLCAAASEEIH